MTAFALRSMTNNHGPGFGARILRLLQIWRNRSIQRSQLARLTEHELQDFGFSRSTIAAEIDKPFWRS